ncbi:hypothetical protein [Paenibacillus tundrae]
MSSHRTHTDAENRSFASLPSVLFQHIFLAGFHGYFVVIIFQFYILFHLFKRHLGQWNPLTVITVSFIINIALFLYHSEVLPVSDSKRIDMLLLTTFFFFGLYQFASRLQRVPRSLLLISDYSFGIYLVHWFNLHLMAQLLQAASLSLGYFTIPVLFLGALTFSIIPVYLLNPVRVGKYVVGQIRKGRSATPVQVERSTTGEVPA